MTATTISVILHTLEWRKGDVDEAIAAYDKHVKPDHLPNERRRLVTESQQLAEAIREITAILQETANEAN